MMWRVLFLIGCNSRPTDAGGQNENVGTNKHTVYESVQGSVDAGLGVPCFTRRVHRKRILVYTISM